MNLTTTIIVTIGGIVGGIFTYLGVRFTARSARSATSDEQAARWNAAYRASAERHLRWDMMLLARLQRVEQINGINEAIPDPPPLFPSAADLETKN